MAERQQLLKHHGDLHTVRRSLGIELEGVATDWEFLVVRRAGDRPVDVREAPTVWLIPTPNFRRCIIERGGHFQNSRRAAVAHESKARFGRTVLPEYLMSRLNQLCIECDLGDERSSD
jgi:hypothetical protein